MASELTDKNFTFYPSKDQTIFMEYFITQYPNLFDDRSHFVRKSLSYFINYLKSLEGASEDGNMMNILEDPLENFNKGFLDYLREKELEKQV